MKFFNRTIKDSPQMKLFKKFIQMKLIDIIVKKYR